MKNLFYVALVAIMFSSMAFASEAAASRLGSATTVLTEIMATPDSGIPEEILGAAKCIAVVPSLLKGGFVVGGSHGRGMATCRTASGWSAPAPLTTTGGSIGFQIGGQAVDVVMVVMNDRGMQALLTNKFKLGADASVAAGPVGRHAEGATDWKLRAEVLTYSRARGLFAGISFNGAVIKQDEDATRELYGRMVDFKTILTGAVQPPQSSESFHCGRTQSSRNGYRAFIFGAFHCSSIHRSSESAASPHTGANAGNGAYSCKRTCSRASCDPNPYGQTLEVVRLASPEFCTRKREPSGSRFAF